LSLAGVSAILVGIWISRRRVDKPSEAVDTPADL
jgi:hypothetical protein